MRADGSSNPDPCEPMRLVLQGAYTKTEKQVLKEMYTDGRIDFVSDPDGLLQIGNTAVVFAPTVPREYPLMQILADDFQRPAAFIVEQFRPHAFSDEPCVDPQRTMYTLLDRDTPRVVRMLDPGIQYDHAGDGLNGWKPTKEELSKCSRSPHSDFSWLAQTDLWVKLPPPKVIGRVRNEFVVANNPAGDTLPGLVTNLREVDAS
ncbi:hypothetical protein EK21DRAFT_111206 [Setomelanomma holmii]|uniref:Uncharacterized protein n=1 Tax=Setomelanomma holmii TaxID=210430 RepID=A0A9P4HBR8_9PLEO|nr:hypothetical protein EK21DRAFT_111206 [Setomelanomma holmii]